MNDGPRRCRVPVAVGARSLTLWVPASPSGVRVWVGPTKVFLREQVSTEHCHCALTTVEVLELSIHIDYNLPLVRLVALA